MGSSLISSVARFLVESTTHSLSLSMTNRSDISHAVDGQPDRLGAFGYCWGYGLATVLVRAARGAVYCFFVRSRFTQCNNKQGAPRPAPCYEYGYGFCSSKSCKSTGTVARRRARGIHHGVVATVRYDCTSTRTGSFQPQGYVPYCSVWYYCKRFGVALALQKVLYRTSSQTVELIQDLLLGCW